MFGGTQQAKCVMTLTLEGEHRVHNVLEHARPGQPTFFCDVADHDDGKVAVLCLLHESMCTAAHLDNRTRGRGKFGIGDRLDAVDDDKVGGDLLDRIEDVRQTHFCEQPHVFVQGTETFGPQAYLLGAFFGRDVEGLFRPRGE